MEEDHLMRALLLGQRLTLGLDRVTRETLSTMATSNQEIRVLLQIHAAGSSTPSQLAAAVGARASVVSRILATLEQEGIVRLLPNPADGRSRLVTLTRSGRARVRRFESSVFGYLVESRPLIDRMLAALGAPDFPESMVSPASALAAVAGLARAGETYVEQVRPVCLHHGMSTADERFALCEVVAAGQARPKDLGKVIDASSGHTSNVLNRLEDSGLIERNHVGRLGDRRAVVVSATPDGHRAVAEMLTVFNAHSAQIAAALRATRALTMSHASGQ